MVSSSKSHPNLDLERRLKADGHHLIAGVDEVGRGSWAGPVVAAAVILPLDSLQLLRSLRDVRDSKQLTAIQRDQCFSAILEIAVSIGIGWASHHVVDRYGLAYANASALHRAVRSLPVRPQALLLDHFGLPDCPLPQLSVTKGDAQSLSIASASIVAKVIRDRWMARYELRCPGYGFERHKGYGTARHQDALRQMGPCSIHRLSFSPFREEVV